MPSERPSSAASTPLDAAAVLWVAALDRVPIEERVQWVAEMEKRVAAINAKRASTRPFPTSTTPSVSVRR